MTAFAFACVCGHSFETEEDLASHIVAEGHAAKVHRRTLAIDDVIASPHLFSGPSELLMAIVVLLRDQRTLLEKVALRLDSLRRYAGIEYNDRRNERGP